MSKTLDGIRILDLTRLLPGGVCTMMLADMGADVVKIEDPDGGDYARWMPPVIDGLGAFFRMNNRNKRSVVINLKDEAGQAVFKKLVESADVLIEGFRPGVMARFGCGYDDLRVINPRLVYCSLSGWGADGPYVNRSGHDLNYISAGGITGAVNTPQPPGGQIADIGGAYIAVAGVLASLFKRERTDLGSCVDVALSESALPFVMLPWIEAVIQQKREPGLLTGGYACYNIYSTKDGKRVSLAALEPKFWANFCGAVGLPDLSGENYLDPARQEELKRRLAELFATKTANQWREILHDVDCCFEVVAQLLDVADNPHIKSRGMMGISENDAPWMRSPVRLSGEIFEIGAVPGYGEHTRSVLREAGYEDAAIDVLTASGAIREMES